MDTKGHMPTYHAKPNALPAHQKKGGWAPPVCWQTAFVQLVWKDDNLDKYLGGIVMMSLKLTWWSSSFS